MQAKPQNSHSQHHSESARESESLIECESVSESKNESARERKRQTDKKRKKEGTRQARLGTRGKGLGEHAPDARLEEAVPSYVCQVSYRPLLHTTNKTTHSDITIVPANSCAFLPQNVCPSYRT